MVRMFPVSATTKPAPAETVTDRTDTVKPSGAPSFAGSSEKLYWVLAMHTGSLPKPSASSCSICALASADRRMPAPP